MNRAKIFIAFTFLLAFAVCVSAQEQTPKIVWKNLQEKYERFEDIKPVILNNSNTPIFMPQVYLDAIPYGNIQLLKFDNKQTKFVPNYTAFCGTISKEGWKQVTLSWANYKLNSNTERQMKFDDLEWFYLTKSDIGSEGFTEEPNYNGTGEYKFQMSFSQDRKGFFVVESPIFQVIEKDFKK